MWDGLGFGKGAMVQGIAKQATGVRPYTSSNEVLFLRGGAATATLGKLAVTPFFSWRGLDGALSRADDGRMTGGTLGQPGLHRTRTVVAIGHAVLQWGAGVNG